jgi:osmotically-inducible protein OsmY
MLKTKTVPLTDKQLQEDVIAELDWEPSVNAASIRVAVEGGIVTLSGTVGSYLEKKTAERVVKRVTGVKAIAEDLTVKLPSRSARTDTEIARAAVDALRWHVSLPDDIKVTVEDGVVALEGMVDWDYQRTAAEHAVQHLTGVRLVSNYLTLRPKAPKATAADIKKDIKRALERSAEIDAAGIEVEIVGSKAILSGAIRSWAEGEDALRAARAAPGVTEVENRMVISRP